MIDGSNVEIFTPEILENKLDKELAGIQAKHESRMEHFSAHRDLYLAIFDAFAGDDRYTISLGSREVDIMIAGSKADLVSSLRILYRLGLGCEIKPADGATAFSGYFYPRDVQYNYLNPKVWFSFTSTQCIRKQVGTRLEEVPVYETICSDDTSLEQQA